MLGSHAHYFSDTGEYRDTAIEECFNHITEKGKKTSGVNYISPLCVHGAVTRRPPTLSAKRKRVCQEAYKLFLPLCHDNHWYLFWVEKNGLLRCLDGKNGKCLGSARLTEISCILVDWLNSFGEDEWVYYDPKKSPALILEQELESGECGRIICYYAWHLANGHSTENISKAAEAQGGYEFFQEIVESVLPPLPPPPKEETKKIKILAEINQGDESDNESDGDVEVIIGTPPSSFLPSKAHNKRTLSDSEERQASKRARVETETEAYPVSPRKLRVFF